MLEILLLSLLYFVCEDLVAVKREGQQRRQNYHSQRNPLKYKEFKLDQISLSNFELKEIME